MTRVEDNERSAEAERAAEEQRRIDQKQDEKSRLSKEQFSKLVAAKQSQVTKANRGREQAQGHKAQERGNADSLLAARHGIQANTFQAKLQQTHGDKTHQESKLQTHTRDSETHDTRRVREDGQSEAENKRVNRQSDKLAAISRDDRQERHGDGELGSGGKGTDSQAGNSGLGQSATPMAAQASGAGPAAPMGAGALPPQVIQQIVDRVTVGVNKEGLSEFQIQFKENVLGGSTLKITAKDGKIYATFLTKDANVKRLVKASEGPLARALDRKGLRLERLDVEEA